jgi:hypothetical protein
MEMEILKCTRGSQYYAAIFSKKVVPKPKELDISPHFVLILLLVY